jgi:hypothetical protein
MRLRALCFVTFLFLVPALFGATINCTAGVTSVPVFSLSTTVGQVGDYTLNCTGSASGVLNVDEFLNVPILNLGGWEITDGVNFYPGTLILSNVVDFGNVNFNVPLTLTVENIFVNPSLEPAGFSFNADVSLSGAPSWSIPNPIQEVGVNETREPATLSLVGLAFGGLFLLRRVGGVRARNGRGAFTVPSR